MTDEEKYEFCFHVILDNKPASSRSEMTQLHWFRQGFEVEPGGSTPSLAEFQAAHLAVTGVLETEMARDMDLHTVMYNV